LTSRLRAGSRRVAKKKVPAPLKEEKKKLCHNTSLRVVSEEEEREIKCNHSKRNGKEEDVNCNIGRNCQKREAEAVVRLTMHLEKRKSLGGLRFWRGKLRTTQ